jgi:signal transduction histidine kinase
VVAIDEADLALLLDHLVTNAVKYSGGRPVRIRAEEAGSSVRLVVADLGIGIPDEDRPLVFEPFFRAPNAKAAAPQGTGLGLAIVKAVTDRCGLAIELERNEGGGTTVSVELPLPPA